MLYTIVQHYPWWAVPVILILIETAHILRSRNKNKPAIFCLLAVVIMLVLLGLFFYYDGFTNARPAMSRMEEELTK